MTNRQKIQLSIELKELKREVFRKKLSLSVEQQQYDDVIEFSELIKKMQSQIDDLRDLLAVNESTNEFDEQFEILKKYLEV